MHLYNDVNAFASKLIHEVEWNRYIIIVKFFTQLLKAHRKVSVLKGICCCVQKTLGAWVVLIFRLELTRSKVAERSACMHLAPSYSRVDEI